MQARRWTDKDFDAMSWNDCHVHGFRVIEGQEGSGGLELDVDYILEWKEDKSEFSFLLVPATLRFQEVFGLRMSLHWSTPSAAFGPFSLEAIERTTEKRANYTATMWRLVVNWPTGDIGFEGTGFIQQSWGREVLSKLQGLRPDERIRVS